MGFRRLVRSAVVSVDSRNIDRIVNFYLIIEQYVCAWWCRHHYARVMRRLVELPKERKIRVLMIVSEPAKWKCQTLYESLSRSTSFDVSVGISAWNCQSDLDDDALEEHLAYTEKFFDKLGDRHVRTVRTHPRQYLDLRLFNPDIVIYNEQWRPAWGQGPVAVSSFALTFFIPYYVPIFGNPFINCQQPVEQLSYVYFTLNEGWTKEMAPFFPVHRSTAQLVALGYPALDYFARQKDRRAEAGYVIFAPHFAIPTKNNPECNWPVVQSTFDWSGKLMLRYAQAHSEIKWVFKPHPLLREKIALSGFMTKEELDEYYEAWARIGVVCCTGDYQDIFLESRVMLTDSASFLPEYAATGRPLIHLWCDENKETPPETSLRLMDTFYRVSTPEELEKTLKLVVEERRDPKREERLRVVKELGLCDNDAAKNIVAYFKDLLGR